MRFSALPHLLILSLFTAFCSPQLIYWLAPGTCRIDAHWHHRVYPRDGRDWVVQSIWSDIYDDDGVLANPPRQYVEGKWQPALEAYEYDFRANVGNITVKLYTPKGGNEYMHFYYQNQAAPEQLPLDWQWGDCEIGDWVERPKSNGGRYDKPYQDAKVAHDRVIKCSFNCTFAG
ncbi:hypothetical protein ABW19_dt0200860 [Dactylella cylindrospora]|nr:hypothetical protein ABW19_dt0200860 [Dactylella cylindrospora]